jgi:hypothetical protein
MFFSWPAFCSSIPARCGDALCSKSETTMKIEVFMLLKQKHKAEISSESMAENQAGFAVPARQDMRGAA